MVEALLASFQEQLEREHRQVEEKHKDIWHQLHRVHKSVVARLEAENATLRAQLDAARQSFHTQVEEVKAEPSCDSIVCDENRPPSGELTLTFAPDSEASDDSDLGTVFADWSTILGSPAVHLRLIADDQTSTMIVHKAVLQRSPYFQARLADHWHNAKEEKTGLLPLRLPPGCPVAAATVVIRYLYTDVEEKCSPQSAACFARSATAGSLRLGQASVAIGAAQLSQMLLLEDLAEELSRLAQSLLVSSDEAAALQERFVALPEPLTKVCEAVQLSPAVELRTEELALMLRGSAPAPTARPQAAAVLAAAGEGGGGQACREAVISALEAMPFKVPAAPEKGVDKVRINRGAFEWLWDLTEDYVLVSEPYSERTESGQTTSASSAGRSLLSFFTGLARAQELHSSSRCFNEVFDETCEPVRLAFGAYLQHLAIMQHCDELSQAFRLGAAKAVKSPAAHRSQTCTIHYPNMLHFGLWPASQKLLPRLLQTAPAARAVVLAGLLELPAEALAELVTDRLLEALGPDAADVCSTLAKEPTVLASWATRNRLLAMPLLAQRRLCASLAPSLGTLQRDIAQVVVQVLAGNLVTERAKHRGGPDRRSDPSERLLWLLLAVIVLLVIGIVGLLRYFVQLSTHPTF